MDFILARKLFAEGQFVGDCDTDFAIPCKKISNTPRLAYLVPTGGCCGYGVGYALTMQNPNPGDDAANANAGILQGVFVEVDGIGSVYDAETVADITDACNACCDADPAPTVTAKYDGTFPNVSDIADTVWTLVKLDNGGVLDFQRTMLDYAGQYTEGTFKRTAYNTGTGESTYTFSSSRTVAQMGAAVSLTETARTFDSNAVAAGGAGFHFKLVPIINGTTLAAKEDDAYNATSDLATALNADAVYSVHGTWSAFSATVIRLSSTSVNTATLTLSNVAD